MPPFSPPDHEIVALRSLLAECLRRIDHLEDRLSSPRSHAGDGAATAPPGPFRIWEVPLSEPTARETEPLQPTGPERDEPLTTDPFAFLNVSPITHAEGPGVYRGVGALLGGLAISTPAAGH